MIACSPIICQLPPPAHRVVALARLAGRPNCPRDLCAAAEHAGDDTVLSRFCNDRPSYVDD